MTTIHPVLGIPERDLNIKRIIRELVEFRESGSDDMERWWALRKAAYKTLEYRRFLVAVRKRCKGKCECGAAGTQVHHKVTVWADPTKLVSRRNGVLVCDRCHDKAHARNH